MSYILPRLYFRLILFALAALLGLDSCIQNQMEAPLEKIKMLSDKGEFSDALRLRDSLIKLKPLTPDEIQKADSMIEINRRVAIDFRRSKAEVTSQLAKYFPDPESLMAQWEQSKRLEQRFIDGEKRYFAQAVPNLFRLDSAARERMISVEGESVDSLDIIRLNHTAQVIDQTKKAGALTQPVKFGFRYTITLNADAVPDGETVRCWMPFAGEQSPRQQSVKLIGSSPEKHILSPSSDLQRSVYLEQKAKEGVPTTFSITFETLGQAQYFDLEQLNVLPYDTTSPQYRKYTAERPPQILFSDKIKSLAKEIVRGTTHPAEQVKMLYRWIDSHIVWASALEYSTISNIPEYVLETGHGDCGMQTLLLMTMARSLGIPVKWQSGWMLHPGEVNLHDWCEVYYEGVGWVPLDQSFGTQQSANPKLYDFYISGIDSYRLIVNEEYGVPLTPAKRYMRSEPYDFQRGELEWDGGNLYFDQWDWQMEVSYQPIEQPQ